MSFSKNLILLFFLCFCFHSNYAQVAPAKKDTTKNMYTKINKYSKRNNFTKTVYKLIFKSTKPQKQEEILVKEDTLNYDGKIIRKINIITLDPFGYSVADSTVEPKNWGERTGNRLHLKTKKIAIYNLLLIKKNTPYDGYKIEESERIIRSQRYVSAVRISKELVSKKSDSIDVTIRVLDSWTTIGDFSISTNKLTIGLKEKDFLGTGQQLDYRYSNRFDDGNIGTELTYTIPNIRNTFVSSVLHYNNDLDNNYSKSIGFERSFFSQLTKWAGGIYVGQEFRKENLEMPDLEFKFQNFKYNSKDIWGAKATKIFEDENKEITNLIVSGRFLNIDYLETPSIDYDPTLFYSNEKMFLAGIGINRRKFIKDNYIFRNGMTEDVPIGKIYGLTFGYQNKNNIWRPYFGGQISFGNYYKLGFLSMNFEAGTFFHESKTYQTSFLFEANYFTKLYSFGKWKIRQFINPKIIIGANHENIVGDNLTINDDSGIVGFSAPIYGNKKVVLSLQTQAYSPYELGGFRLNPYFNYSVAILGNPNNPKSLTRPYSKVTIGLLISNDYLVFSTFQLSLSYYPSIPFDGENIIKTNAFSNSDYGIQTFELAKPRTVKYN